MIAKQTNQSTVPQSMSGAHETERRSVVIRDLGQTRPRFSTPAETTVEGVFHPLFVHVLKQVCLYPSQNVTEHQNTIYTANFLYKWYCNNMNNNCCSSNNYGRSFTPLMTPTSETRVKRLKKKKKKKIGGIIRPLCTSVVRWIEPLTQKQDPRLPGSMNLTTSETPMRAV